MPARRPSGTSAAQLGGIVLAAALAAGALVAGVCTIRSGSKSLMVYCAAGMRMPIEEIAARYTASRGVRVELQFGGSNTLLNQLEVSGIGDLFLAADDSYIRTAQEKGLAGHSLPIATIRPVIVTRSGSRLPIDGLADLTTGDLRLALGSPEAAAVGRVTKQALEHAGRWDAIESQVRRAGVFTATVNQAANDVKLGSVDVGIVWDAVAAEFGGLNVVHCPELDAFPATIEIAVLESSNDPASATRFARFVVDPREGLPIFAKYGFDTTAFVAPQGDGARAPSATDAGPSSVPLSLL